MKWSRELVGLVEDNISFEYFADTSAIDEIESLLRRSLFLEIWKVLGYGEEVGVGGEGFDDCS